jgi:hypothetical protein
LARSRSKPESGIDYQKGIHRRPGAHSVALQLAAFSNVTVTDDAAPALRMTPNQLGLATDAKPTAVADVLFQLEKLQHATPKP